MGKRNERWRPTFMGLNKREPHPRNIYKNNPDIKEMAIKFPELRPFVHHELTGKVIINYKDREALYMLVKLLLKKDFNIDIDLPVDRLVPGITLRLNYLLWIEDILDLIPSQYKSESENVKGIDIGTGASCIYALLAVRKSNWNMLATELDEVNFDYAKRNVELNCLQDKITVNKVNEGTFLNGVLDDGVEYDFCMCNPPFFSFEEAFSPDNKEKDRTGHRPSPKGAKTGSSIELVTPGGEVAFINNIIEDSKILKEKVKVYTTMMGHRKTLDLIGPQLSKLVGNEHLAVTTFHQGQVTRWGIAWTFNKNIKFSLGMVKEPRVNPSRPPVKHVCTDTTLDFAVQRVRFLLDRIQIDKKIIEKSNSEYAMELKSFEATWQNQRKRRREEERTMRQNKQSRLNDNTKGTEETKYKDDCDKITEVKDELPESLSSVRSSNTSREVNETKPLILDAIIVLKSIGKDIVINMSSVNFTSGWDAVYQLMTYLKNHWNRELLAVPTKQPN